MVSGELKIKCFHMIQERFATKKAFWKSMLCSTEEKVCSAGAVSEGPDLLGLGNNQKVCEEEKVSLLGLQTRLQLHVAVQDERSVVAYERLHKGPCLWADG